MLKLTAKEFREKYGISEYLWIKYHNDIIDHLEDYIEFHMETEGNYKYYIITKELKPYEPFKKKSIRAIKFYEEQTSEIVKKEPLQTGINIARNVIEFNNKFNHKQDTAARYVRPILKSKYQKGISSSVSCLYPSPLRPAPSLLPSSNSSSLTMTSVTYLFVPSFASYERTWMRPSTATRLPLWQ